MGDGFVNGNVAQYLRLVLYADVSFLSNTSLLLHTVQDKEKSRC